MGIFTMVLKEMRQHRLNLALSVFSVAAVAACLGGVSTVLRAYENRQQTILVRKQDQVETEMKALEDDYRKITKKMGFNVLILPKNQNLAEFYSESFAAEVMPEEYVQKLANSDIVTIQHLLPSLQQKTKWPEYNRTILLTGVRDEVPIAYRDPKTPIQQPVPEGGIVLGHELASSLDLQPGKEVALMGKKFTVAKVYGERGNIDDITVWINLGDAQQMLDKEGKINGILALECSCAWADLPQVREEIEGILPGTQVIEKSSQALARAETRWRAAEETKARVEHEIEAQATLQKEREGLAGAVLPVVVAVAAIWIGFLAWSNVRERRPEIGILRAMGWRGPQIMGLFLGRAAMIGLLGGAAGYLLGWGLALAWDASLEAVAYEGTTALTLSPLFNPVLFASAAVLAPVAAILAGWLPAQLAAAQDPADILRGE